jgi:diaminohydroxyphosphoribosylaminopyrimidine deaminase/5-amino-6-(5-phosphoribosylamino)uracil reductase
MAADDAHWMRRALHLARRQRGATWPNPTVGACVVRDGVLVGDGFHAAAGQPHAEVAALRAAGERSRGATLYVALEPCNHFGLTPPCTQAILAAGVTRVVFATRDSNPRVAGGGGAALRRAGLEIREGVLAGAAWELNHPFFETDGGQVPHVTLKLALSADGRLARQAGPAPEPALRRITGERAHRRVHWMRALSSCVVVGWRTIELDHPRLTARGISGARQPRPVVLDARLQLAPRQLPKGSLLLASPLASAQRASDLAKAGHEVQRCAVDDRGRLDWAGVLQQLAVRGLGVVLVEGGATLAGALLAAGAPHRVHLLWAPALLGGDGPALGSYPGPERRYETVRVRRVGEDLEWVLRRPGLARPAAAGAT